MKKTSLILTAIVIALLAACTPPAVEPEAAPSPTALDPDDPLVQDAQQYAEDQGISPEEAVERMNVQQALGESGLAAALMENEADTFAGLWIEHEPAYRIVVAFTEGGEQTIQPYLEGADFADLVEVRSHRYTYAELRTAQEETMRQISELGVGASSGIDVQENRVTVTVGNPELLREELAQAGFELPEPVEVEAMDPENLSDTLHAGTETYTGREGQTITFPMQAPSGVFMDALAQGTLLLDDNGCLRLGSDDGDDGHLIIWRRGFTLRTEGTAVEVLNPEGEVVGRVGEPIRMGGGEGGSPDIPGLSEEICPGPYWIMGQIEPLEEQATPD